MVDSYLEIPDICLSYDVIEYVNIKDPMNLVWAELDIETVYGIMLDAIMLSFLIVSV